MGRLLDLGVIGNYGTPPNDTTQNTGYRQLAPGTGRLLIWDPHTLQWRSDPLKAVAALP